MSTLPTIPELDLPKEQAELLTGVMTAASRIRVEDGEQVNAALFYIRGKDEVQIVEFQEFGENEKEKLRQIIEKTLEEHEFCVFAVEAWMAKYDTNPDPDKLQVEWKPSQHPNKREVIMVNFHDRERTLLFQCEILGTRKLGEKWEMMDKDGKLQGRLIPNRNK